MSKWITVQGGYRGLDGKNNETHVEIEDGCAAEVSDAKADQVVRDFPETAKIVDEKDAREMNAKAAKARADANAAARAQRPGPARRPA